TGNNSPAVLLIPGSGPSDCNETIGLLTPFKDIALGLAKNGINSLRFEKRTYRYPDRFTSKSGIDEEYYDDCKAAVLWLEKQEASGIYLLGHSLGGQITAVLAKEVNAKGVILFNSSARHLADISADQYSLLDPSNKTAYEQYAQAAKATAASTAKGLYYYGVTDYYWASYNQMNVIESLKNSCLPVLIINSTADNQTFTDDLELWEKGLSKTEQVTIKIYDDISHIGYKIDTNDTALLYKPAEFPVELINEFVRIIK
ncbi:MAG: alpha/beta hydrolase fold domain-containing protein, partial [Oscillospiraceae bacterium]|nr:alpha/beta hydrolase fold domain-containing protein [Oscillospiraceae bacterium]